MNVDKKLAGCHPDLIRKVKAVIAEMATLGHPMIITDGLRTTAQQQRLYQQGRTKPGHIVTNADGLVKKSNHQAHKDGLGHAADCCFVVDGKPSWDVRLPWKVYGEHAKNHGLRWGGDWVRLHDLPHVELP